MKYQTRNIYLINWPEYPLMRITICFIIGILFSEYYQISTEWNLNLLIGLFASFIIIGWYCRHDKVKIRTLSTVVLLLGFSMGMLRGNLQKSSSQAFHYSNFVAGENIIVGQVSDGVKKKKRYSATLDLNQINGQNCVGSMLLYFSDKDSIIDYEKGDVIALFGKVQPLKSNTNPRAFDYKQHLKHKGIDSQMFLKEDCHKLIEKGNLNTVEKLAFQIRKRALGIFEDRLKDKDQLATASAMVLGYRNNISEDLYKSFSETGAVHVLAVSGLHVGIICMIFIAFFNRFNRDDFYFKFVKLVSLLIVVWLYAMVTGASPAVLRASVMFSLILIGRLWFKGVNIYNILAFSALLLLVYNPYLLFQLSFQFSYLALISIIYFQPKIEKLYDAKFWISTKIWQLSSVSIAAQILVFPISIFYFHTFPTYFIISGVAAVFLATFILGFGLLLLCFNRVPYLGDIITTAYSGLLDGFISIISAIQSLPYNHLEGVYFSLFSVMILYLLIGSIMVLLSLKPRNYKDIINKKITRKRIAKLTIGCGILLLFVANILFDYRRLNHTELLVYNVSKSTVIDVFYGEKVYTLKSFDVDLKKVEFASKAYRIWNGNPKEYNFESRGVLLFKSQSIVFAKAMEDEIMIPCFSNVLMVTNDSKLNPLIFLKYHDTNQVVVDNSIDYKLKIKWKKECEKYQIPLHDIYLDGIFSM